MNLTLAAIRRPVWVVMLMLAALILGWMGCKKMPVEENPEVTFPYVTVQTSYFGSSPNEIETQITKKIEEAVTTSNGIESISSTSLEGISIVTIQFDLRVNQDTALNEVKSKVDAILGTLPDGAEKPIVNKLNVASQPILTIAAESTKLSALQLRDLIDDRVKDRLARIQGVADVEVTGGEVREIRVAIDKNRLLSYGTGITDVLNSLRGAAINLPGGNITEGNRETGVRVEGEFRSVDEIKKLEIPISDRTNPNLPPAIVRLADIATITDGPAERQRISRVNGRDAVVLTVQKTREGNTVAITDQVKAQLKQLEAEFPLKFTIARESAKQVGESLHDLEIALFIGIVLVIGIIYLFLHNFRGTLIVALAIPTCVFAALAAMSAFGFTLNTMTMLGLSLAIGILVDDAIVVLENTYRHLTMGEDPQTAALNGRREIGLAAIAITMVDVVVFLPVANMGGILGQFFRPFAVTVAAATLFSLFVSFTLTPMLASRWYRKGENLEDKRGFAKWFDEKFHRLAEGYRRLLDVALNRRWLVFMSGWALLFGAFMMTGGSEAKTLGEAIQGPIGMMGFSMVFALVIFLLVGIIKKLWNPKILLGAAGFGLVLVLFGVIGFGLGQNKGGPLLTQRFAGGQEQGQVLVDITMPAGSSLERTLDVVKRIEKIGQALPEVTYVTSKVGSAPTGFGAENIGPQYAQVAINLADKKAPIDKLAFWNKPKEKLRDRDQASIVTEVQQKIGKIPDAKIIVSGQTGFAAGPPVQVSILSTEPERVAAAAKQAKGVLSSIPGIVNLDLTSKPGKPELVVRPNRTKMADNDITVQQLGAVARTAFEGNTDAKYRENDREYDIRVNLTDSSRQDANELANIPVTFRNGNPVFLGEVANIQRAESFDKAERFNRQRQITVIGYLLPGFVIGTVGQQIEKDLKAANLGDGKVFYAQRGENEINNREMPYLAAAFGLGLILVFLVLAALFNNIVYPFIVQLAQPQALVGAILGLVITNRPMDIVSNIGFLMLIGLVGKNAILLVDYTNTLRERGLSRHDALVEAGPTRLRPIMMTTLAMILSMLPVALALGRGADWRAPLGIVIIGGLALSTLLTLFVIPCSYTIFDDLSISVGQFLKRFTRGLDKKTKVEAPPSQ